MTRRLAVVGAGKMGSTLLKALLDSHALAADEVVATVKHEAGAAELRGRLGIAACTDNRTAIDGAEVVLLAVKPQALADVLGELGPVLAADQLVVSIVASATIPFIEERLPLPLTVVRAMPNTQALIGEGMTVLCGGSHATGDHLRRAEALFHAVGRTMVLDEKHMDAVTALSASGPAFVYVVLESLAEGGVKVGLPRHTATELAAQMCLGAAKMVLETGEHPALLKDAVTTPAGCTIDGLLTLEEGGIRVTLIKAVVESTRRAGQLVAGG
ncbi:MAG TPA: pyrroline-5-carboxylate reductase [Thermoanaerobaculia bacterium]|nr:pyrroline-5-carboxylate reductase [Thermoanaerobaculia bacterium]